MRQPIKKSHSSPEGRELCVSSLLACSEGLKNYTKTLMEGGFCPESITPAQYRGRLGGGGCFFASFFTLKKVR